MVYHSTNKGHNGPSIEKVYKITHGDEIDVEHVKEVLYGSEQQGEQEIQDEFIKIFVGDGSIVSYTVKDFPTFRKRFAEYERTKSKINFRFDSELQNGAGNHTEAQPLDNDKTSSEDGVFFDAETQGTNQKGTPQNSLGEENTKHGNYHVYGEDIAFAPVQESTPIETSEDIAPINMKQSSYAPLTEDEANERDMERAEQEAPRVANVLTEEPKVEKKKSRFWSRAMELVGDKGFVFENLAKKTKNRELEAKWNSIRYAESMAQDFIGEGAEGVRSIVELQQEVEEAGLTKELYEYVYHLHNIDRMSLADLNDTPKMVYHSTRSRLKHLSRKTKKFLSTCLTWHSQR